MKNGLDRRNGDDSDDPSNVVSFKDARARAEKKARERTSKGTTSSGGDADTTRITLGQWIVGGLFMLMAIGGAVALVRPFVKGAGIVSGMEIG